MPCSPLLFLIGDRKRAATNATYDKFPKGVCRHVPQQMPRTHLLRAHLDWAVFTKNLLPPVCCTPPSRFWIGLCSPQNLLPPVRWTLLSRIWIGLCSPRTCYRQYVAFLSRASGLGCVPQDPVTARMGRGDSRSWLGRWSPQTWHALRHDCGRL
jgi:hypothetical protein